MLVVDTNVLIYTVLDPEAGQRADVDDADVFAVALNHGLSSYDALFLATARALKTRLLTADGALISADAEVAMSWKQGPPPPE